MRWICCFCLLLWSLCEGAIACKPRYIESITYHSQHGDTLVLIELTDRSIWKWSPDFYSENLLRNWQKGDEVLIHATCQPGLLLQNRKHPHYMPRVALSFQSYLLFPSIDSVNQETIYLSDGSSWAYLYDFNKRTLRHWALGDRIVPVRGLRENFQLINLDIPHDTRTEIERFIEVLPKTLECQLTLEDDAP